MNEPTRRSNSLRYAGFDYSGPAGIFITFCSHNRQLLFGTVSDEAIGLSSIGSFVAKRWVQIPEIHPGVQIDEFIIMPDHVHGILWFGSDLQNQQVTCSEVVRWLKISVQRDVSVAAKHGGARYKDKLWQRGFYDRIIRNDQELEEIRHYIRTNPDRWRNE